MVLGDCFRALSSLNGNFYNTLVIMPSLVILLLLGRRDHHPGALHLRLPLLPDGGLCLDKPAGLKLFITLHPREHH